MSVKNAVICVFTGDCYDVNGEVKKDMDIRVVLHRTRQDTLGLPGGIIDPVRINGKFVRMETPEEAALREFYEETGVRVRFVDHVKDCKIGADGSYPLIIMDSTVISGCAVFAAKWLCDQRMNTDAWKNSAKARQETTGVYATKVANVLAYDCKPGSSLLHGGNHYANGTRVRGCAIESIKYIQSLIRRFNLG